MNYDEGYRIMEAKAAQQARQAIQSWDYLNQNDSQYAELVVRKDKVRSFLGRPVSVQDVRKHINRSIDLAPQEPTV